MRAGGQKEGSCWPTLRQPTTSSQGACSPGYFGLDAARSSFFLLLLLTSVCVRGYQHHRHRKKRPARYKLPGKGRSNVDCAGAAIFLRFLFFFMFPFFSQKTFHFGSSSRCAPSGRGAGGPPDKETLHYNVATRHFPLPGNCFRRVVCSTSPAFPFFFFFHTSIDDSTFHQKRGRRIAADCQTHSA